MFLFLTTCLFWTFAFGQHNPFDYAEILPPKGQCPEGKDLDQQACAYQDIYRDDLCEVDCWGGTTDVSTHGCGCIIDEDGKLYYNEPSGKSCNAGKEVSMICKKEIDVETCEDVDGWSVHCNSECGSSLWYPAPEYWYVLNTHGNIDYSHFTIAECAALCVGDCVAFEMHVDGCGSFYSGLQFSSSSSSYTSSCVQRTPSVEGDCADYDAGEGWAVDCEHYCERYDVDGGTDGFSSDVPWTTGVSITQCAELCEAENCDHFNFNPQNGGSCQFFNEPLAEPGTVRWRTDGACVYRGSDDTDNVMSFDECPDSAVWELLQCFEIDDEGNFTYDIIPESSDGMTDDDISDAICVWLDDWFSKGGCCEDCNPCLRETYEAWYHEAGYDLECESEDDFFTKIKNGDFSSLTTLELVGIGVSALVLLMLLIGICCCCCKCSNGKH